MKMTLAILLALPLSTAFAANEAPAWPEAAPAALRAFVRSCPRLGADWQALCQRAATTAPENADGFFAQEFDTHTVQTAGGAGLLTAYFEPIINASPTPTDKLNSPLYAPPENLKTRLPYASRTEIESGNIAELRDKVLYYVDRFDGFLLGVQGSGRVRLPDGKIEKLTYAGKNGHAYTSLGKVLVNSGEIPAEKINVPAIRNWLQQHPDKTNWLLQQNASYVFFAKDTRSEQTDGPPGAMALKEGLTPGTSIAVDPGIIPLGIPVQLISTWPDGRPLERLVVAQDKGGAIKGTVRADLFMGSGEQAEQIAGLMNQPLQIRVLWPKGMGLPEALRDKTVVAKQ